MHGDWNVTIHVCWLFVFRYLIEFQICFSCVTIFIHNKTSPNTHTNGVVVRAITLCFWPSWGGWRMFDVTEQMKIDQVWHSLFVTVWLCNYYSNHTIQMYMTKVYPPPLLRAVPWNMRVQSLRLVAIACCDTGLRFCGLARMTVLFSRLSRQLQEGIPLMEQ